MPFQHSENLDDQNRSVLLFTALGDDDQLGYAQASTATSSRASAASRTATRSSAGRRGPDETGARRDDVTFPGDLRS